MVPRIRMAELGGYKPKRKYREGSGRGSLWPFKIWTHLFFASSPHVKWIDDERRHFRTARLWKDLQAPANSFRFIEKLIEWDMLAIESRLPGSMVVRLALPKWMKDDADSTE